MQFMAYLSADRSLAFVGAQALALVSLYLYVAVHRKHNESHPLDMAKMQRAPIVAGQERQWANHIRCVSVFVMACNISTNKCCVCVAAAHDEPLNCGFSTHDQKRWWPILGNEHLDNDEIVRQSGRHMIENGFATAVGIIIN